jgi:hypothetical protein
MTNVKMQLILDLTSSCCSYPTPEIITKINNVFTVFGLLSHVSINAQIATFTKRSFNYISAL